MWWLAATGSAFGGILIGPVTNAANSHVYYLLTQRTWNASQAEAVRLGGNLVTINNAAEQDWVFNTFSATSGTPRGFWIGLNDFGHEGNFTWISGETAAYRNWAPGEPNNGGPTADESFVHMWALGNTGGVAPALWNDLPDYTGYANFTLHGVVEVDPASRPMNLVVNGSFEFPLLASGANYFLPSELTPWQTTDASFEVWLDGSQAVDGVQHLEILAQTATATVWQTVTTIPGEDYALSFYHAPSPSVDSTLTVAINLQTVAILSENGSGSNAFHWQRFRTNFTASSSATTISFTDTALTAAGTHIDNVILTRLPAVSTLRVSEVELCWETVATKVYQVQTRSALTTNLWTNLGGPIQGNGTTNCFKDAVPAGEPQRFYRVTVP